MYEKTRTHNQVTKTNEIATEFSAFVFVPPPSVSALVCVVCQEKVD